MESAEDKQWASKYLLDPLTAPAPSEETGPGTTHMASATSMGPPRKPTPSSSVRSATSTASRLEKAKPTASIRSSKNPFRKGSEDGQVASSQATSPQKEEFPNFDGSYTPKNRMSSSQASTTVPVSTRGVASSTAGDTVRTRRTSSLSQRHPGDNSHRPLDTLRAAEKKAQRAPHLRKKHHVGADSIDGLDTVAGNAYHHEGPYDATLMAKNTNPRTAPVEAVRGSNIEALRATPREKVKDSIDRHYPLDGVAVVPSGLADRYGRVLRYKEGEDMMIDGNPEGGAYKRWPGMKYHPDDLKGKGEPSYSIEKALKSHNNDHRRNVSESNANASSYEMHEHSSSSSSRRKGHHNRPPASSLGQSQRPAMPFRATSMDSTATTGSHRDRAHGASSAYQAGPGEASYKEWEAGSAANSKSNSIRRKEVGGGASVRKRLAGLNVGQ